MLQKRCALSTFSALSRRFERKNLNCEDLCTESTSSLEFGEKIQVAKIKVNKYSGSPHACRKKKMEAMPVTDRDGPPASSSSHGSAGQRQICFVVSMAAACASLLLLMAPSPTPVVKSPFHSSSSHNPGHMPPGLGLAPSRGPGLTMPPPSLVEVYVYDMRARAGGVKKKRF